MVITQTTGVPGGAVTVQIRGRSSLQQTTDPLYIVDGAPYPASVFAAGGNYNLPIAITNGSGVSPFSFLNLADIESIEVLKDADATAIYGSRGANGVVLITTKKGKSGSTKVSATVQSGIGKVDRMLDLMNTQQYLQMRREAFANDGITPTLSNAKDLLQYDQNAYTNWQKVFIGGTAHYTDAQASVSGGTTDNQYLIGAGYHRETTVFPGNFNDQKGSLHFSQNISSANQRLKIALNGSFVADNNVLPINDFTQYINLAPNSPALREPDGSINWTDYPANPLGNANSLFQSKNNNLLAHGLLSYQILPGLEVLSNLTYNTIQTNEVSEAPSTRFSPVFHVKGTAAFNKNNYNTWSIEPQINYNKKVGKGTLNALVGATAQYRQADNQSINATGYTNDALLGSPAAASAITLGSIGYEQYRYNSFFARVGYNWEDKYLLNLTGRRDGSSRFGPGKQYGDFGAIGAAWVFSNESFAKAISSVLSFGKLRASYGTTGNEPALNYQYLELYQFNTNVNTYNGSTGITPKKFPSPDFSWEVDKKLEFGLDLGLYNDRINLSGSWYRNRTGNQLVPYQTAGFTGFPSVIGNLPAVIQNTSWEFTLNSTNIKSTHFSWITNLNLTIPHNKLISFPNIENSAYAGSFLVGQPIGQPLVYKYAGVNPQDGYYQFYNKDGSLTENPDNDSRVYINTAPKFYGGFQNTFKAGSFQLDVLLRYVKQTGYNAIFNNPGAGPFSVGNGGNVPVELLDSWKKAGDVSTYQKFSTSPFAGTIGQALSSTGAYTDASFIRCQNVALSYNLPKFFINRFKIDNLRIFINAENLFTITKFKGVDPENQSLLSLPPLRVITTGIQLTL